MLCLKADLEGIQNKGENENPVYLLIILLETHSNHRVYIPFSLIPLYIKTLTIFQFV